MSDTGRNVDVPSSAQRKEARHSEEIHQLHHVGLLVVSRVLVVNPERLCGDGAHCKAMQGSEKQ